MNNITNLQAPKNVTRQQAAPQKNSSSQSQTFNSPKVPQQVTSLVQQLLQSSKESKAGEHAEHTLEYLNNMEDDFQYELNEHNEIVHTGDNTKAGQRDGGGQQSEQEEDGTKDERALPVVQMPVSVSGGGITVGVSASSAISRPIPDSRVIAIQGHNYTVSFLKRQVGNDANSSQGSSAHDSDSGAAGSSVNTAWGGAGLAGSAGQFESYISSTFPNGDPNLSSDPVVKYDGSSLVVAGQVYGASLTDPKQVGSADSFLVGHAPEQQAATLQVLGTFDELEIINDLTQADGSSSYMVRVPADYYGQWQAALMDSLPVGSTVRIAGA